MIQWRAAEKTLVAAYMLNRKYAGFEIQKNFYVEAHKWIDDIERQGKLFTVGKPNERKLRQKRLSRPQTS